MKTKSLFILFLLFGFVGIEAKQKMVLENIDVLSYYNSNYGASESRNPPVSAEINGHMLTISINENVSVAQIMIMNSNGIMVEFSTLISSPNTKSIYISENGYYRVDIILNNGDQYYGNFSVQD